MKVTLKTVSQLITPLSLIKKNVRDPVPATTDVPELWVIFHPLTDYAEIRGPLSFNCRRSDTKCR